MRRILCSTLLAAMLSGGFSGVLLAQPSSEVAAFVTLLGDDTLAVERFTRTATHLEADVVLRTPRTTRRHYVLERDGAGHLVRFEATTRSADAAPDAPPIRREVVSRVGDSLAVAVTDAEGIRNSSIAAAPNALPFIDMIHWPFELVLRDAFASGADSLAYELFTGRGSMSFVVSREIDGTMSVRHPYRGTMQIEVGPDGELLLLDAGATTRKLVVQRVRDVDVASLAHRFASLDAASRPFGELSGRGETEATLDGARLVIDYGRPSKRGRDIFGALVPWGERWRTGANMATHFETDQTLLMHELEVPPGRYTLFAIPEPEGGTLIISRQTGQTGTSYDPDRDLGRVPMTARPIGEVVEEFTIAVVDTEGGGELQLRWDRTVFAVPFRVR